MRIHLGILSPVLAVLAVSCDTGGGGDADSSSPPGNNSTWVTDTSAYEYAATPPVDTSAPDHLIQGTPTEMIAALQAALDDHASGGVILFDTGGADVTLTLSQQLYIHTDSRFRRIVIDGGDHVTLDGNNTTRILEKGWLIDLTVQNMRFVNGSVGADTGDDGNAESGAAINVESWAGSLTVTNCEFVNCHCTEDGPDRGGGAIRAPGQTHVLISDCTFTNCSGSNGGAVCTLGSRLTILSSSFTNCSAHGYGGGTDAIDYGGLGMGGIGGAIYTDGLDIGGGEPRFVLYDCTLTNNVANDHGGAIFNYTRDGIPNVTVISGCLFEGNSINYVAGTSYMSRSGAIYTQDAECTFVNTTFSNNSAHEGGGAISLHTGKTSRIGNCTFYGNSVWTDDAAHDGSLGGALDASGNAPLYVSHCTFAENVAGAGAAIRNGSGLWLKNCVFADNHGKTEWNGHTVWQTANDAGGNLQWPQTKDYWNTSDTLVTSSVLLDDPLLGALTDNGGPTATMALTSGSPAIDAGEFDGATDSDQRGTVRDESPDAGAYEFP